MKQFVDANQLSQLNEEAFSDLKEWLLCRGEVYEHTDGTMYPMGLNLGQMIEFCQNHNIFFVISMGSIEPVNMLWNFIRDYYREKFKKEESCFY